jgi:hypothetical protein
MAGIRLNAMGKLELSAFRTEDEAGDVTLVIKTDEGTVRIWCGGSEEDATRLAVALGKAAMQALQVSEEWDDRPDEDEYGSQDGDGFIILDGGRYYPQLGREQGFTPADMPRNGYPDTDVAAYELAGLMAEHDENPDSWVCGEHGPSERDAGALVDSFLDSASPDIRLKPLNGVRYEPGTEVRWDDSTWEVRKDYGQLGVWLVIPVDPDAGRDHLVPHKLTDRADDLSRARRWIAECNLVRGEVADLPDAEVKRIVERLYEGGWAGFAREAELLRQARAWALENTWLDDPEDIEDMPDDRVWLGIEARYEGGRAQFKRNNPS